MKKDDDLEDILSAGEGRIGAASKQVESFYQPGK